MADLVHQNHVGLCYLGNVKRRASVPPERLCKRSIVAVYIPTASTVGEHWGVLRRLTDAVPAVVVDSVADDLNVVAVVMGVEPVADVVVDLVVLPLAAVVSPRVVPEPL